MNGFSHRQIMGGAYQALPEEFRQCGTLSPEQLLDCGNYPDYFDDPTRPEELKRATDPNWKTYTYYPPETGTTQLHFFPLDKSHFEKQKMYAYLLQQIHDCFQQENYEDYVKFMGCFSHAMGDSTQPAHIGPDFKNKWLSELLPIPDKPELKTFHYHTTVEAVNGICQPLTAPRLLGESIPEIAWMTAVQAEKAASYCRRFIVPTILALFDGNQAEAERLANEPVTLAAQLTLDSVYSVLAMDQPHPPLSSFDLRHLPAVDAFHDLVYNGNFIVDHNRKVPPNNGELIPGTLLRQGKQTVMPGLGMLPHSGMERERDVYSTWRLPPGVFRSFHAWVGMNPVIGQGAVRFQVELEGTQVWDSGPMTENDEALEVSVLLGQAEYLTLRVTDANDGRTFWTNHAYWGTPELVR